jgi:hypothetical protein
MSEVTTNDKVKQTVLYLERGNYNDEFRFILRTDGSGIIYDVDYEDEVTVEHTIDLNAYAASGALVLTDLWDATSDELHENHLDEIKEPEIGSDLEAGLQYLLDDYNEQFENPLGDAPDDIPISVSIGDAEDLEECLAAVVYLSQLHGLENPNIAFYTATGEDGYYDLDYSDNDPILKQIIIEILETFQPIGATYEYVDENDGRVTAYAPSGRLVEVGTGDIELHFPSARERLECRNWLRERFIELSIDPAIIDTTFPLAKDPS